MSLSPQKFVLRRLRFFCLFKLSAVSWLILTLVVLQGFSTQSWVVPSQSFLISNAGRPLLKSYFSDTEYCLPELSAIKWQSGLSPCKKQTYKASYLVTIRIFDQCSTRFPLFYRGFINNTIIRRTILNIGYVWHLRDFIGEERQLNVPKTSVILQLLHFNNLYFRFCQEKMFWMNNKQITKIKIKITKKK